jgi:dihydrofolate synthase/folylpolyglutamate synthase
VDYAETLAYLYARLPMFQRIGKAAYKADLSNTHALMELTGHPERGLRSVHVAGTNGKGSTSHLIASALQEAGYTVGLHTSPHLKDFRERFRILRPDVTLSPSKGDPEVMVRRAHHDNTMIPEAKVIRFVEEFRAGFEPIEASFFEWGVALALWWFREEQVDIAVIETGMGGRLDSTNVITPEVSVITNIGLDHMDFLGRTVEAIAGEKAGIIKHGVPVVAGEAEGSVAEVFRAKAAEEHAPITFVDQAAALPYPSGLPGAHQERNARTALSALKVLQGKGWSIPEEAIAKGFRDVVASTGLRGRWEVISHAPLTIVDVAHNAHGLRTVRDMLLRTKHDHLHVVLGTVNDKDLEQALRELPDEATYYFCKADIPRGLDAEELRRQGARQALVGFAYPSVKAALEEAQRAAGPDDLVLVTGSVFVVAEVL